jgi:hypothetical protein
MKSLYKSAKNPVALLASITAFVTLAAAFTQTKGAAAFGPLSAYVGTWIATNPGESTPFLVLTLSEANGALTGTMSSFTEGGAHNGTLIWRPLPYAETEISDLRISDSSLWFHWVGDPPLHGGDVKFVAEGTDVASINIPISEEEWNRIFANNWGLGGASPTIRLRREGAKNDEYPGNGSLKDWGESTAVLRLINQAEFQYKLDHGMYADYPTLLHSGRLERTKGLNFTAVPIDLRSEVDPFPGHMIRLKVSTDGSSYQISIEWKASADCDAALSSNQTGVATGSHTSECNFE